MRQDRYSQRAFLEEKSRRRGDPVVIPSSTASPDLGAGSKPREQLIKKLHFVNESSKEKAKVQDNTCQVGTPTSRLKTWNSDIWVISTCSLNLESWRAITRRRRNPGCAMPEEFLLRRQCHGYGVYAVDLHRACKPRAIAVIITHGNGKCQWGHGTQLPHAPCTTSIIILSQLGGRENAGRSEKARLHTNVKRRPTHLLSGLLRCGCCGSGMSVHDRDKTGKTRIRCSAVRESGSCTNRRIVYLRDVEKAVLNGMREELKDQRLIESYARKYNEERQRLAAAANATRARLESKHARIESERQRNIDMVVKGVIEEDDARQRIADLKARRLEVEAKIGALDEAPKIVSLHPATLDRYTETVDTLAASLAEHAEAEDDRGQLVESFRVLVQSVTIHTNGPREGFHVEVKGKLAALTGGDVFPQAVYSGGRVVAEEGFEPPTHGL
jgi:Recombinase zinc beta ribbon domain